LLYDKRALYARLAEKLSEIGVEPAFPLDVKKLAKRENIDIRYHPFDSEAIGAVLYKGFYSAILINSNKSPLEQRFDLAHELIHFWLHPSQTSFSFQKPHLRDKEKEWQANEGAAQLLLPYSDFIPKFVNTAKFVEENYQPLEEVYSELARFYKVAPVVVDYRIRNLESEILQYINGVPIERVILNHLSVRFDKNKTPVLYLSLIRKVGA
jgi:hypothetical protein